MKTPTEQELTKAATRLLRDAEHGLDALTVARLRAARLRALDHLERQSRFTWLGGNGLVGAGLALALAGLVWFNMPSDLPSGGEPSAAVAEIDLLASESPDFYSDLEFYNWLADEGDAG
jgi:hypothetical protein